MNRLEAYGFIRLHRLFLYAASSSIHKHAGTMNSVAAIILAWNRSLLAPHLIFKEKAGRKAASYPPRLIFHWILCSRNILQIPLRHVSLEFIQWFGLVSPQSLKNSQIHCTKYSQHATWPLNLYIPLYIIQWELTLTYGKQ